MNLLQISRGKFSSRFKRNDVSQEFLYPFHAGELFEVSIKEDNSTIKNLNVYDAGLDPTETKKDALISQVNIGDLFLGISTNKITKVGTRGSVHIAGELPQSVNKQINISAEEFDKTPGSIYLYKEEENCDVLWGHPNKTIFVRKGDMIYFNGYEEVEVGGQMQSFPTAWVIENSGGKASYTLFESDLWNFPTEIKNAHEALVYLDGSKFKYGAVGPLNVIENGGKIESITVDGVSIKPGNLYQITEKPTVSQLLQDKLNSDAGKTVTLKKYDFIAVDYKEKDGDNGILSVEAKLADGYSIENFSLKIYHGGASDAIDIAYKLEIPETGIADQRGDMIASESHKEEDKKILNVKEALDNIYKTKADLIAGKIPTTQLPDTVLGALQFKGQTDSINITVDYVLEKGNYYIYNGLDVELNDPQEITLTNTTDNSSNTINLTYNKEATNKIRKGDWIVLTDSDVDGNITRVDLIDHTEGFTFIEVATSNSTVETFDKSLRIEGSSRVISGNSIDVIKVVPESNNGSGKVVFNSDNVVVATEDFDKYIPILITGKKLIQSSIRIDSLSETDPQVINFTNGRIKGFDTLLEFERIQSNTSEFKLIVPAKNGTLATLDDLNLLIENGTENFLQKIAIENGKKKLIDSRIKDTDSVETFKGLKPHDLSQAVNQSVIEENKRGITIKNGIAKSALALNVENDGSNNSVQYIPTHSGTLLNDESVIDCGNWV